MVVSRERGEKKKKYPYGFENHMGIFLLNYMWINDYGREILLN